MRRGSLVLRHVRTHVVACFLATIPVLLPLLLIVGADRAKVESLLYWMELPRDLMLSVVAVDGLHDGGCATQQGVL